MVDIPSHAQSRSEEAGERTPGTSVVVSVVMVNWNVKDLLVASLESLYARSPDLAFEVFVVDNASRDGSADAVAERFPAAHVIRNAENVGFSRANNQAIRLARGEFILLVNPDTLWLDDSLTRMVAFLAAHPEVGAAGPMLLNADRETIQFEGGRRFPTPFDIFCDYTRMRALFPGRHWAGRYLMPEWDHADSRQVECLSGSCLLVRREVFADVGLFDELYPFNFEDIDFCYRCRHGGWSLHYLADARIVHLGRQSIIQSRGRSSLLAMTGMYRYFRTHFGVRKALLAWMLLWPSTLVKLCSWICIYAISPTRRAVAAEQAGALWKIAWLWPAGSRQADAER